MVTVKAKVLARRLSGESAYAPEWRIIDTRLSCARPGSLLLGGKIIMLTWRRMGELEPWIDENFVRSIWYNMGETVNVKMIRDKFSG